MPKPTAVIRCDADWGSAMADQRCTRPDGHDGDHIDAKNYAWRQAPNRPTVPVLSGPPGAVAGILLELLTDVADAKADLAAVYAAAYLAADGTREQRAELAKQATVGQQRAVDIARAVAEAYRLQVDLSLLGESGDELPRP